MMKEELWSLAQDTVDIINESEMIKPERYEVSMAVAQIVTDVEYAFENNDLSGIQPYIDRLNVEVENTPEDAELVGLVNTFNNIALEIMQAKLAENTKSNWSKFLSYFKVRDYGEES